MVLSKASDFLFMPSLIWVPFGHRKREDIPATGIRIDATRAVTDVVDEILRHAGLATA